MFSRPCKRNNGNVRSGHAAYMAHNESVMFGAPLRMLDSFVMFFPGHVGGDKS